MKRYVFTVIAATLMFGAASAREVAYCDSGFDIQAVSGDKAVCQKKEKFWDNVGTRLCPPLTTYSASKTEANDGGDLCYDNSTGMIAVPAILCPLGQRTDINRGARDRCQVEKERTIFGNIKTRQE